MSLRYGQSWRKLGSLRHIVLGEHEEDHSDDSNHNESADPPHDERDYREGMRSPAGLADRETDLRNQSVLKADRSMVCPTNLSHQREPRNGDSSSHTKLDEVCRKIAGDASREHEHP